MQPSLQPDHVGGPNPDSLGDRGRFSPNLNALQTGKFQPSNQNMALPDRQGPPGPQGFRDNKNHDNHRNDGNRDNGGRNGNGREDGGHSGGQGPH